MQAALFLDRQGYPSVRNLTGGVDAWARQVDPAMPVY
jgi:rhodanese-related sulfurtransferase